MKWAMQVLTLSPNLRTVNTARVILLGNRVIRLWRSKSQNAKFYGGIDETHQYSPLHSCCLLRFGDVGTATCGPAIIRQIWTASNGQPGLKDSGPNSKPEFSG